MAAHPHTPTPLHSHALTPPYALLACLWLHEPDSEAVARAARELGLPPAGPAELAAAYTDVFLLNVYPYGTAFTDDGGELNGPEAQRVAAMYEASRYEPPELHAVGAPDHLGLCLGFLAHLDEKQTGPAAFISYLREWAPVCCLAVEREPSAHAFYRSLAAKTRVMLLHHIEGGGHTLQLPLSPAPSPISHLQAEDEVRLRDLVRFFLAPAQCGVFLSRSRLGRMARALGTRLPFGSRFEVAESLFTVAGEGDQVERLLAALEAEIEAWAGEYRRWAATHPAWQPVADVWLARTGGGLRRIAELREIAAAERP